MIKIFMASIIISAFVIAAVITEFSTEDQGEYIGNGTTIWKKNGKLHRDTGPAAINKNGSYQYYIDGKLSRSDGPASFNASLGNSEWWLNGKRHRIDGPALEFKNGTNIYFVEGKRVAAQSIK